MTDFDTRRFGMRMVKAGLVAVGAFVAGAGLWLIFQALSNPDVRLKRPRWIENSAAFDHSFWWPVIIGVVGGAALVALVLWTAYRRLRSGEDLYAQRHGKGVRRRGEAHLGDK